MHVSITGLRPNLSLKRPIDGDATNCASEYVHDIYVNTLALSIYCLTNPSSMLSLILSLRRVKKDANRILFLPCFVEFFFKINITTS